MDIQTIQQEVFKVKESGFAQRTDKQLWAYQTLYDSHQSRVRGVQPPELRKYNNADRRNCKLSREMVLVIRSKYIPHVYGKEKLAKEFGVSTSVVYRILKGQSGKDIDDSG